MAKVWKQEVLLYSLLRKCTVLSYGTSARQSWQCETVLRRGKCQNLPDNQVGEFVVCARPSPVCQAHGRGGLEWRSSWIVIWPCCEDDTVRFSPQSRIDRSHPGNGTLDHSYVLCVFVTHSVTSTPSVSCDLFLCQQEKWHDKSRCLWFCNVWLL